MMVTGKFWVEREGREVALDVSGAFHEAFGDDLPFESYVDDVQALANGLPFRLTPGEEAAVEYELFRAVREKREARREAAWTF